MRSMSRDSCGAAAAAGLPPLPLRMLKDPLKAIEEGAKILCRYDLPLLIETGERIQLLARSIYSVSGYMFWKGYGHPARNYACNLRKKGIKVSHQSSHRSRVSCSLLLSHLSVHVSRLDMVSRGD
eukprot:GHVU01102246.1.p1 GENE.GHVU01102246.1~~GHVU01102246.1.p1  ORF type:complete len:125 (-),score=0.24 GHVU01102246.1:747-1121(-)